MARAAGDDWAEVEAAQCLAYTHLFRGQFADALAAADAVIPALDRLGHGQLRAWDCAVRADVAANRGHFAEAISQGRAGFELATAVGEPVSAFGGLLPLLRALVAKGRAEEYRAVLERGLRFLDSHPGLGIRGSAALAAAIVASTDDPVTAVAAAESAFQAVSDLPVEAVEAAILLATARLRSGDADGARAAADIAAETAATLSLTPTEREVVALAAQGRSNQDIAARLLVSTGTVRTHLRSVYAKLGLINRAELAAHAAGRDL